MGTEPDIRNMHCECVRPTTTKNDSIGQRGGHTLANRLTEACRLGLQCTFLILTSMVWSGGICLKKISAEHIAGSCLELMVATAYLSLGIGFRLDPRLKPS